MRRLSVIMLATAALFFTETVAQADVSWDLIITDKTVVNMGGSSFGAPELPAVEGTLTVSNAVFLAGGLFYDYSRDDPVHQNVTVAYSTTDFNLHIAHAHMPLPQGATAPQAGPFMGSAHRVWNHSGNLAGMITDYQPSDELFLMFGDNTITNGVVGSDGPSICGDNRRCTIEGHWELKSALPVPEPGTMGVLLAAIAMLGLRHWHRPSWGGRSGRFVAGDLFPALHGATAAPRLQRNRLVVSIS